MTKESYLYRRKHKRAVEKKTAALVKKQHIGEYWNPKSNKWEMKTPPMVKHPNGVIISAGTAYARIRQHKAK